MRGTKVGRTIPDSGGGGYRPPVEEVPIGGGHGIQRVGIGRGPHGVRLYRTRGGGGGGRRQSGRGQPEELQDSSIARHETIRIGAVRRRRVDRRVSRGIDGSNDRSSGGRVRILPPFRILSRSPLIILGRRARRTGADGRVRRRRREGTQGGRESVRCRHADIRHEQFGASDGHVRGESGAGVFGRRDQRRGVREAGGRQEGGESRAGEGNSQVQTRKLRNRRSLLRHQPRPDGMPLSGILPHHQREAEPHLPSRLPPRTGGDQRGLRRRLRRPPRDRRRIRKNGDRNHP
mmetsp:Transcript_28844/g.85160  ORF Transcript_28844/g.85160 Transcript_28844/m.85160 type:complete len:290 (+) Transcript_28844:474-1343(+)